MLCILSVVLFHKYTHMHTYKTDTTQVNTGIHIDTYINECAYRSHWRNVLMNMLSGELSGAMFYSLFFLSLDPLSDTFTQPYESMSLPSPQPCCCPFNLCPSSNHFYAFFRFLFVLFFSLSCRMC